MDAALWFAVSWLLLYVFAVLAPVVYEFCISEPRGTHVSSLTCGTGGSLSTRCDSSDLDPSSSTVLGEDHGR